MPASSAAAFPSPDDKVDALYRMVMDSLDDDQAIDNRQHLARRQEHHR